MIELNVDLSFLTNYLGISTSRVNNYTSKNIEEIIKEEEALGNTKASEYASLMQKPERVLELFHLVDPQNRYAIIKNMSSEDCAKLLPYLSREDLIWGMQYFTKDKLQELFTKLPKKEIFALVLQNFDIKDIINLMPTEEMDRFLKSDKIERKDIMKYFAQMDEKDLRELFAKFFGPQDEDTQASSMMNVVNGLDARDFQRMIMNLDDKYKNELIGNLIMNEPKFMMELENSSIVRPMMMLEKQDILKSCKVLEPDSLIKMVEHLPDDLIQVVATQIDPEVFANILIDKFADIISKIAT